MTCEPRRQKREFVRAELHVRHVVLVPSEVKKIRCNSNMFDGILFSDV